MPEIHVQLLDGRELVYREDEIPELLRQGKLSPEAYYWREGMNRWRHLRSFRAASQASVPDRRTDVLPDPINRPPAVARPLPGPSSRTVRSSRRFRFRRQPGAVTFVVQLFLVILVVLTAAELVLALPALKSGANVSSGAETPRHLQHTLGWLGLGLNLVFVIPYCIWVHRASINSHAFSSVVKFKPGWAVGCHFVPVMNLIRPYQAMQEIWKVSGNPRGWQNDPPSALVSLWWTCWLLTVGLAEASFLSTRLEVTPANFKNALFVFLGLKVVQITCYLLFLTMITLIFQRQVSLVKNPSGTAAKE